MSRAAARVFVRSVLCEQEPFTCGKHRRTKEFAPIVIQIYGNACKLVDKRKQWVLNERTKSIDPAHEAKQYEDATSPKEEHEPNVQLSAEQQRAVRQLSVESGELASL